MVSVPETIMEDAPPISEQVIKEAEQAKDQYMRDSAFLRANEEAWGTLYPDQWVAVYEGNLYGPAESGSHLRRVLHCRRVPLSRAVVKHLSSKRRIRIL